MATAAFGAIVVLARNLPSTGVYEADGIDDFKGLAARSPWLAGMMLCAMMSLAGIPPFLGFWAKLAVLRAAIGGDLLWLAIVGIVFAVIGCFYYLRVCKAMYFDAPPEGLPSPRPNDRILRTAFGVYALALLALGLAWNPIMAWCQLAFQG
jgi:NADH-quinone oxidoreductase subunit N